MSPVFTRHRRRVAGRVAYTRRCSSAFVVVEWLGQVAYTCRCSPACNTVVFLFCALPASFLIALARFAAELCRI
jgi:hypothetical protein